MSPDPSQMLGQIKRELAQAEKFGVHLLTLGRIQGFACGVMAMLAIDLILAALFWFPWAAF